MASGAQPFDRDKQQRQDIEFLLSRGEFKRFLLRVIQSARIFQPATDGSNGRNLVNEGRRDLGLEILSMVEAGQPIARQHEAGPILTIAQTLLEEINQPKGRQDHDTQRYDRTSELDDQPDDDQAD